MPPSTPLGPGERAPDFVLPRGDGVRARLYGMVGGAPTSLVFAAGEDSTRLCTLLADLRAAVPADAPVHLVRSAHQADAGDDGDFHDEGGHIHTAYGVAVDGPATVLVVDPNVRVAAVHVATGQDTVVTVADVVARTTFADDDTIVRAQAPVLLVPDALDDGLRRQLVQRWESADPVVTGVEASTDGERRERADALRKRRRDHTVTDPDLLRTLTEHVGRRVMPEVQKAFAYQARRFEGFKVGCYEATTQGFFEAHRDNLSPATAHRRFALSLNLNDDYEGGELRFPEYGRQRYRPDAGAALVFSGSHLHEVLPVTRGRRLVLLSFLFTGTPARGA